MALFILESFRTFEVTKDERKINRVNEGRDEFNYEKTFLNQSVRDVPDIILYLQD